MAELMLFGLGASRGQALAIAVALGTHMRELSYALTREQVRERHLRI